MHNIAAANILIKFRRVTNTLVRVKRNWLGATIHTLFQEREKWEVLKYQLLRQKKHAA